MSGPESVSQRGVVAPVTRRETPPTATSTTRDSYLARLTGQWFEQSAATTPQEVRSQTARATRTMQGSTAPRPTLSSTIEGGGEWVGRQVRRGVGEIADNPFLLVPGLSVVPKAPEGTIVRTLQDGTGSAIRGAGEFAASTVEDVASMAAHPWETAKGLGQLAVAVDSMTPVGATRNFLGSQIAGRPFLQMQSERTAPIMGVVDGIKTDFQENREEIGLPGAVVKSGLDIFGLPKTVVLKGGRLASLARPLPSPTPRQAARQADEATPLRQTVTQPEDAASGPRIQSDQGARASRATGTATLHPGSSDVPFNPQRLQDRLTEAGSVAERDYGAKRAQAVSQRQATLARIDAEVKTTTDPAELERLKGERLQAGKLSRAEERYAFAYYDAFTKEADDLIAEARQSGRIAADSNVSNQEVAWGIMRDAQRRGLFDSRGVPGLKKRLAPYFVDKVEGFSKVANLDRKSSLQRNRDSDFRGLDNFDGQNGTQLLPDQATLVKKLGNPFDANRVLQPDPPTIKTPDGEVRLYNASAGDVADAMRAVERIQRNTPALLGDLKELHFERLIENTQYRYSLDDGALARPAANVTSTQGYVLPTGEPGTMVIRPVESGNSDLFRIQQLTDSYARSDARQAARLGREFDPAEVRRNAQQDAMAAVEQRPGLADTIANTVAHETGHAFDKQKGWKSVSGEWGPHGEGTTFSRTEPTDFLTDYSRAHQDPVIRAKEDFAETVAFISQFPDLANKPALGPFSDTLVAKLRGAGQAVGTPPQQIEEILAHYGRAPN